MIMLPLHGQDTAAV